MMILRSWKSALYSLCFIVAFASAIGVGSTAAVQAQTTADNQTQITAVYQRFIDAFKHKDVEALMSVYVHEKTLFVFDLEPPRQWIGWENYRRDWVGFFRPIKGYPDFTIDDRFITISGDIAYTHSAQHFVAKYVNGAKVDATLRVTDVLRKINGKWLIVQQHVSVPVNMTTLKPDVRSKL